MKGRDSILGVGVIGLGVGLEHAAAFAAHPRCRLVVLCDLDPAKEEVVRSRFPGASFTTQAQEVLEDPAVDVVVVASYDDVHYPQTRDALLNGKHVFVEKPLCQDREQLRHLREILDRQPELKISSNLIMRRYPRFRWLKEALAAGELGRPYYIEGDYNYGRLHKITRGWRGRLEFYSVVQGGGIHLLDLMMWLLEDRVVEVAAMGSDLASRGSGFRFDDLVVCLLRFASGVLGKMAANFACVHPHFHVLNLYGTKATFLNGMHYGLLFTSRRFPDPPQVVDAPYPGVGKGELVADFVEAILADREPPVSREDVFAAMSLCLAVDQAVKEHTKVEVRYF